MQIAGVMAAMAVDQHQRVIWGKAAQRRGQGQARGVAAELLCGEGENGQAQGLAQIRRACALGQCLAAQDRDGRGAAGRGHAVHARTGDDHGLGPARVLGDGGRGKDGKCRRGSADQQGILQIQRAGFPLMGAFVILMAWIMRSH